MIIAVYGSLRRGFGNHSLIKDSTYLGEATTTPEYTMLHLGGFPGVVHVGDTSIKCELYDVDDDTLEDLDRLEGHPSFYRRTPIDVIDANGDTIAVETYLLSDDWMTTDRTRQTIASGDWTNKGGR